MATKDRKQTPTTAPQRRERRSLVDYLGSTEPEEHLPGIEGFPPEPFTAFADYVEDESATAIRRRRHG
jgi:hypothetical protein